MYKVLWFDDKPEENLVDKENALLQGIKCICFKNAETGLKELIDNYKDYQAVILDGLFYKKATDKGTPDDKAFGEVAKILGNLKAKGTIIPWFIYSGQPSFAKEKSSLLDVFSKEANASGKVFDKNNDDDFIELCNLIKIEADKNPITQARRTFPEVFIPFQNGIIDIKHEHLLLDILINYMNGDCRKKNVTVQRDLLEAILKSLNNPIPYLKNEFFDERQNGRPNLENCVKYIEDKRIFIQRVEFRTDKRIKQTIQSAFRILKESTSELSHLNDNEIVKYPFLNNTFLLLQILIWLPGFVDEHYEYYI
ncbi:hypothetical protein H9I45_15235 [Polaribacter haliotis]|uniref:Uncharacterized protein n=1 Tax=Polaribacter haliotis TaxID=1888915 RepID=A0A7L8AF74_9FLAO|nr:hypothetical protein [Polaribacter haliotis]QOD60673.1 hypothetical protein H9I45_15235 [Polaribacter haliotis]